MKKTIHPYYNAKFIFHTNGSTFLQGLPGLVEIDLLSDLKKRIPLTIGENKEKQFKEKRKIQGEENKKSNWKTENLYLKPKMDTKKGTNYVKIFVPAQNVLNIDTYSNDLWIDKKTSSNLNTSGNIETPLVRFKRKYK